MSSIKQRQALKETIESSSIEPTSDMKEFMRCEECNASFEFLFIGGKGDWQQTIMCEECFHIRRGVPYTSIIIPLRAIQEGLSVNEASQLLRQQQEDYLTDLAELSNF